jgi:hypothetical protein
VALALTISVVAIAKATAPTPRRVEGEVMCLNHEGSVGIWVKTNSGGSWAQLHDVDVADGWGWTRFSTVVADGGSYSLNVGCGGNPQNWEMTAYSDTLTDTAPSLVCNDIPPWLMFLGKRVMEMIFPIIGRAFGTDIPYGHCQLVHQVGDLAPKPDFSPTPMPTQPEPVASALPTIAPAPTQAPTPGDPGMLHGSLISWTHAST